MGVEKPKSKLSAFITRACRLPKEVAGRVGNLSDTMAKERLKAIQSQNNIPYKYLTAAILILLYLPWMISLTCVIPPQIEVVFGSEVDSESYSNIISTSEVGVTHAVLLNTTPFSFNGDWELDPNRYWNQYDFYSYGWNDSDGYHFTSSPSDYADIIVIERTMQIPIANYSELTVSAVFEGVSGSAGIFFEVFADDARAVQEDLFLPGNITTVNVTAPLSIAKLTSDSWLCTIVYRLQIWVTEESHVKLRGIIINAEFTGKMSLVQLDFKSTDNTSFYENPYMKFAKYAPRLAIIQNNDYISQSTYFPNRVDDEIYLPPGTYEGVAYWNLATQDPPDPYNSSTWVPNVNFVVTEDIVMEVDVGLFAKRIDFDVSPSVLLRGLSLRFVDDFQYSESTEISGSTVYSQIPDYLYIPGEIESLSIWLSTWSYLDPQGGYGWVPFEQFRIEEDITIGSNNRSRNLQFSVTLPYTTIGGVLFGLGEFVILTVILLLVVGFLISLRRTLRYSDIRHRLSDSRILPLIMLSAGVFLPWSIQLAQTTNSGYDGVSWFSWFSMPFMIRWSDSTAIQMLLSTPDWWYASLSFTMFLFIPLCYGYLSLVSIESDKFNKTFALALLLPYLVVLAYFNQPALNLGTISLGPIVAMAALPVWLLTLGLRKLGITT
ncbi:MAG: hypothetical protein E3J86_09220 [Candidatus Thorarchaeota archaeon]|nr:MAG: hypothetical protein E3J86_09220 [Candidatus Thorarchaeota archaeon]